VFQINLAENIKTHILCSRTLFENPTVYEIMWKNTVNADRPQMAKGRMRITCWIPKATNTHSHYVILIAFSLQQWLQEHALMLLYMYIECLVNI